MLRPDTLRKSNGIPADSKTFCECEEVPFRAGRPPNREPHESPSTEQGRDRLPFRDAMGTLPLVGEHEVVWDAERLVRRRGQVVWSNREIRHRSGYLVRS